ncbi:KilA-N domain-containing protein [Mariprofundus ferrooxydans]|uniref:KilA-N domain-containing protein n=1 Tax=Mariprofundus ferrooxydans TaxID=314344 RepID=UPI0018CB9048|nr:KilA-N domain-containing protein [Mariprofundus ferrooxydans]
MSKAIQPTRSKYEIIEVENIEVQADVSMLVKSDSLYFNATKIANQFNKDIQVFIRMDETIQYIRCIVSDSNSGLKTDLDCIKTRRGKYGGTWLHQKLALRFARWCSVSFEYQLDQWVEQRIQDEHNRQQARDAVRTGFLPLTHAIQSAHEAVMPYHYSNECNLINKLVLGMNAKQFKKKNGVNSVRDACDAHQIHMLGKLQRINASLIEIGMDYEARSRHLKRLIGSECDDTLGAPISIGLEHA